jgi:simple sugar transport system ATP-binding protein
MSPTVDRGLPGTGANDAPLIEVRGVSKTFGATRALTDVSLTVQPGRTHALVGRNGAGKSTLVSVMTGLTAPDEGSVRFAGEPAPSVRTPGPWQSKVACVYQHRRIVPHLSVAENLLLNRLPRSGFRIDWTRAHRQAADMLDQWNIDLNPRLEASHLSVENAQLVEIVRALSGGSRFVILDEPTAQLVASGVRRLFKELTRLQSSGVTFLYISHHLEEIEELCQDVTVLRNGTVVAQDVVENMPTTRIVEAMVGGAGGQSRRGSRKGRVDAAEGGPARPSDAAPALELREVATEGLHAPVSLVVAPGEVVGIAGHTGSGSREIAEAVFGLAPLSSGAILRGGKPVRAQRPGAAISAGIGFVPEDRHRSGYVPMLSIEDNIATTVLSRLGARGYVSGARRAALAEELRERLDVACSSTKQEVGSLSGGNQQKVVLARALASDPSVLVLVHPTAGVDIASKETLFDTVDEARRNGVGILLVSDEVDELKECDRVLVLVQGRVTKEFGNEWHDHDMVAAMEGVQTHV